MEKARVLLVSDSHGNSHALFSILKQNPLCDALIFCGDGAMDFAYILNHADSYTLPPVMALVRGNNDAPSYQIQNPLASKSFSSPFYTELSVPQKLKLTIAGHKIYVCHGHLLSLYNGNKVLEETAAENKCDTIFFGHTHVAFARQDSSFLFLNPGSCSLPRRGQPQSYAIVELQKNGPSSFTFYSLSPSSSLEFSPETIF